MAPSPGTAKTVFSSSCQISLSLSLAGASAFVGISPQPPPTDTGTGTGKLSERCSEMSARATRATG